MADHEVRTSDIEEDFYVLASSWPPLREFIAPTKHSKAGVGVGWRGRIIDWKDPRAVRELTKAQLHVSFGITWDLPLNRLCPPLRNRLNYIHWIESLLKLGQSPFYSNRGSKPAVRGLDVGVGASCIYPLLGAKLYGWEFVATETDPVSAEWAHRNASANGLDTLITIRAIKKGSRPLSYLLNRDKRDNEKAFDFVMTNPPFFSEEEAQVPCNPQTATGEMAHPAELICPGGEEMFVGCMVEDSISFSTSATWYTAMLGRKSSLKTITSQLLHSGVINIRSTEFVQGQQKRWGIAWSFTKEGMINGKVPDDPTIKVLQKYNLKRKMARRLASSRMSFTFPLMSPEATENLLFAVSFAGKTNTIPISVPLQLPKRLEDITSRVETFVENYVSVNIHIDRDGTDNDSMKGAVTAISAWSKSENEFDIDNNCALSCFKMIASASCRPLGYSAKEEEESNADDLWEFDMEIATGQLSDKVWYVSVAAIKETELTGEPKAQFVNLCEAMPMEVLRQSRKWRRAQKASSNRMVDT
eukprot:440677_1